MTVFMAFEIETEDIDCDADLERLADDALRALEPLGSVRIVPDCLYPWVRTADSSARAAGAAPRSPVASPGGVGVSALASPGSVVAPVASHGFGGSARGAGSPGGGGSARGESSDNSPVALPGFDSSARTSSRSGSASAPVPVPVPVPVFIGDACGEDGVRLPVLGGGEVLISAADIAGVYAPAYPAVDVRLQLMRMRAWLLANAANQKTARGIKRFVVNWLSREQDRAAVRGSSRGAQGADFGGSFDTDDFFSAAVRKSYGG